MAKSKSGGMRVSLLIAFSAVFFYATGQQTIVEDAGEQLFSEAIGLYQMDQYMASLGKFEDYIKGNGALMREAAYYRAMCLLKSGDSRGERQLFTFVNQNAQHPLASKAYYSLGNFYFQQNKFNTANSYYEQANHTSLNPKEKSEYFFKLGYCQFLDDKKSKAATSFRNSISSGNQFEVSASYYLGFIHFQRSEFPEALNYLTKVDGTKEFQQPAAQLIASIHFSRKDELNLVQYIEEKSAKVDQETKKLFNRLLGELYYELRKYPESVRYLQRYLDQSGNRMSEDSYYKLAFSYYQTKDDQKAIENFQKAGLGDGPISQVSAYYLGRLYIRNENPEFAIRSFEKALNGSDQKIKEESSFLVGKINFQQGQFSEAIRFLQQFLEQYPGSSFMAEANQLLANAFLKTSDYDQAIAYLETIENKSTAIKKAYQNATFHKGQLAFNDSKFEEAVSYLKKTTSVPMDREMNSKAHYLLGESYSLLDNYPLAIIAFEQCKKASSKTAIWNINSDYGLAYIFYNQKEYSRAKRYFQDFTDRSGKYHVFYLDAMLRLADCHYVLKDFGQAIKQYQFLTREPSVPKDYINYQLGLTYQLNNEPQKAINSFEKVVNYDGQSTYRDNALFQMGVTYLEDNQYQNAITYFDRFERDLTTSSLMPYVRSKRALCYFNLNQLEFAANDYRAILENYISHPTANDALLGLQELRRKGQKVPGFERYMSAYQQANPDDGSLEVIAFESAKTYYYNQEYARAIESIKSFQDKYPRSSYSEDALYFLGDSYYRMEDWVRSVDVFSQIIQNTSSKYLSRVLDKRGKAFIRMEQFQQALYNYYQLSNYGVNRKDQYLADEGRLISHFNLNNSDSASFYAKKIIEGDWKPVGAEAQALLYQGRLFLEKNQYDEALESFRQVLQDNKSETGAEAKYYVAFIQSAKSNYKSSVETLFELNEEYASYDYWIGKSFVLIADNYYKMGELFQAQATLSSIIEKSPVPEVVEEAQAKLDELEKEKEKVIEKDTLSNG